MTGLTQPLTTYTSPRPIRLPPGNLEPVEELPGDSDLDDEASNNSDFLSDSGLSNIEELDDEEDEGSLRERDPVFEKIKESLSQKEAGSRSHPRSESQASLLSDLSDSSDGPHVQISDQYTSIPYGIQPRATYEHSNLHADIMGVAYNGRMRQFVILDSKGITTWKRDLVDPREIKFMELKDLTPKTFNLNQVRRALQYPKYEYRLIMNIVYAPKYNCYFALGKDFSVKVLNRDFEETCSVNTDMRSVLHILFNPVRDELITGGVGGIKIWQFQQVAGKAFTELKPLANYELRLKDSLPNVGGSWVKRVDLDHHLQHLYCCSDTDLHVYDLSGKMLFNFQRAHTMTITGCCFSPSAKVLITSSVDSEVKVWSLTGGLVHTFRGHSRAVTGMLLHPETSSIIVTSSLDGSVRMWSLETMDLLYMIVVSADGVMWMGLTDDKLLYISTCRNITLWHLNNFYSFWSLARNQVTRLSLARCEEKTTRVMAIGEDSSVRMFQRCNQKNITTVLPPPDISPLQKVLSVCYSREKNAAFLLITNREIWVYTTRTDPACRIAVWNVHDLQMPYVSGDTSLLPPGVVIQPPSQSMSTRRATENGHGNEIISNCCSLCILNSTAMMWTDEGLCCPIRHTYLLLGMDDGRILFMDPVIKCQKYMEFKASKDAIYEMHHDVPNSCLITLCRLKTLMMIQIWGLPQLDAMYEIYCGLDVTCYARVGLSFLTGHTSGQINLHPLEPVEDLGFIKSKQEPPYESVVDEDKRPEHQAALVAMDSLDQLRLFVTCSSDGAIKVWDECKVLMTEVMLEESLSTACFLNEMGDLLVAFKNHIFYIDHSRLCPSFKPPEIDQETSDMESDVYEDPRVLYELIKEDDEQVTLDNYLVPYDHIQFDKDFLEGKTKIEQPKTAAEVGEESETESETDVSMAPSSIYVSPCESIEDLSMIDLTLGADYSKYDLKAQMKATLDYMVAKAAEKDPLANLPPARRYLKLRRMQIANAKISKYIHRRAPKGKNRHVAIETPGQSDLEEKELDMEVEKFTLPSFGESPGGSPSITPPSGQASPRTRNTADDIGDMSDEELIYKKPTGFVPVRPDLADSPSNSDHGSASTHTTSPITFTNHNSPTPTQTTNDHDKSETIINTTQTKPPAQAHSKTVAFSSTSVQPKNKINEQTQKLVTKSNQDKTSENTGSKSSTKPNVPDTQSNTTIMPTDKQSAATKDDMNNDKALKDSAKEACDITETANIDNDNLTIDNSKPETKNVDINKTNAKESEHSPDKQAELNIALDDSGSKNIDSPDKHTKKDSDPAVSMETLESDSKTLESFLHSEVTVNKLESDNIDSQTLTRSTTPNIHSLQQNTILDITSNDIDKREPSQLGLSNMTVSVSTEAEGTSASELLMEPEGGYGDIAEQETGSSRRAKASKVDVRGLMKKRRITSARAPSLTRRSSTDHAHDDHDHDHTHDDKRAIKKKQPMDERKLPPRTAPLDMAKLLSMPPNPPSMLSRKRSLSEQRKQLELGLLHHPDIRRDRDHHGNTEQEDPNVKLDHPEIDMDALQDEQWATEASLHGTTLALPPQRDKNKARLVNQSNGKDPRAQRFRDRKHIFGDKDSVEGETPGVGSSPTAELEEDGKEGGQGKITLNGKDGKDQKQLTEEEENQAQASDRGDLDNVINPDTNIPETQMQRAQRLGLKVDPDKVFENQKGEKSDAVPKAFVRRSKINVYIPQAERESASAKSSHRGTPDSGIDDTLSTTTGRQTPRVPVIMLPDDPGEEADIDTAKTDKDMIVFTEEDKAKVMQRPASSFTGLRRGQLEGERLRAERPHTAHVRFKAEDLQSAFEEALKKYSTLPGTPAVISAEKLYKNDGVAFEDNWQERVIERHTLLRMQKEIRAQSAAQRRQAFEMIQKDKQNNKLFNSRCDSAIGGFSQTDSSSIYTSRRATTSMSVPIGLGYGVSSAPPPTRDKPRPKTANPVMEKQQLMKSELSQEKAFRYRLSKAPSESRPGSCRSVSTVADFSPHWIDPRNPDAWRPKSSRSIPSKCNRYVLVNKPKEKPGTPIPSPLEEQLLIERFPRMGSKVVTTIPEPLTPRIKKSISKEYSPFIYQRFV